MSVPLLTRRHVIQALGGGLGLLGLADVFTPDAGAASNRGPHFAPRAKRVIQLFMNGGPFQADLFDPKPAINKYAGQRPEAVRLRTENQTGGLMPVPFGFHKHGRGGLEISDLLPNIARCADDLCVLRSLHTDNPNHGPALYMLNNGTITPTRPSMGAWLSYGLGTANRNLPTYVVLCPGRPVRFAELWSSGFLPAEHQGTYINHTNLDPARMFPYLRNTTLTPERQRQQLDLMQRLNAEHLAERGPDLALEARIGAMETAFRMQTTASDGV